MYGRNLTYDRHSAFVRLTNQTFSHWVIEPTDRVCLHMTVYFPKIQLVHIHFIVQFGRNVTSNLF